MYFLFLESVIYFKECIKSLIFSLFSMTLTKKDCLIVRKIINHNVLVFEDG